MNYSIALRTLVRKEVFRFIRIWPQTLLPPAITTALYFLIFGKLIGDRIGTINGATYMDYIVPGIILMSVISHSMQMSSRLFIRLNFNAILKSCWLHPCPTG